MTSVSDILHRVKQGKLTIAEAEKLLRLDAIAIIGDVARVDTARHLRRGVPEIIFAASKTARQLSLIVTELLQRRSSEPLGADLELSAPGIIISKIRDRNQIKSITRSINDFNRTHVTKFGLAYHGEAQIAVINRKETLHHHQRKKGSENGKVALLAAGTSDIPVLSEAEIVLNEMNVKTIRFNDVGVAALHRLSAPMKKIVTFEPDAIIVAAGMEGALPSVVAGLSSVPVIGLPTSVGYGLGGRGESALMSMLQACPLGMSVVNIDAGVAAGVVAYLIAKTASRHSSRSASE